MQGEPEPQAQFPAGLQRSELGPARLHCTQLPAKPPSFGPQYASEIVPTQVLKNPPNERQHPLHVVGSHSQLPALQMSPSLHCTPVLPHSQPFAPHRSDRVAPHATHARVVAAEPAAGHQGHELLPLSIGTHLPPRQHVAHDMSQVSHVPFAHVPPSHDAQVAWSPHASADGSEHTPVTGSQHPTPASPAHFSGSHTHRPAWQRCVGPHTWLPHRQPFGPDAQLSKTSRPPAHPPQFSVLFVRQCRSSTA
jgi:hypothetical protein